MPDFVQIATHTNPHAAGILKAALEGEGISCFLENDGQGGYTGVLQIRVLVSDSDAERAREFLESHPPGSGGADEDDPGNDESEGGDD